MDSRSMQQTAKKQSTKRSTSNITGKKQSSKLTRKQQNHVVCDDDKSINDEKLSKSARKKHLSNASHDSDETTIDGNEFKEQPVELIRKKRSVNIGASWNDEVMDLHVDAELPCFRLKSFIAIPKKVRGIFLILLLTGLGSTAFQYNSGLSTQHVESEIVENKLVDHANSLASSSNKEATSVRLED